MPSSAFSMPFGSGEPSLLRQSRFWIAQFAGWLLILVLYFRENIEGALREGPGPLKWFAFATSCGMAMACSSALGVAYLRMPPRWLTGFRAVPTALGLSLLAALPWTTAMTLLFSVANPSEWRGYSVWMLFHASVLMVAWSGVFLWFVRRDWIPSGQARVLGTGAFASEAEASELKQCGRARAKSLDATPSSAPERAAVSWGLDDRVRLQEAKRERFCHVRDIAYIRAADDYAEVHLLGGQVAMVRQSLRYWESRLPESFVRIHRSTLINLDLIEELRQVDGTWRVRLRGCEEALTVSRRLERAVKAKVDERQGRFST